jgi:hypothetical protein
MPYTAYKPVLGTYEPSCPPLVAYLPRLSVLPGEKIKNILQDIFLPVGIQIVHLIWPKTISSARWPSSRPLPEMWQY